MSDATVREAAQYLLNEVRGCTQVFEWAMRDAISNTNFNSLVRRADALEAALAAVEQTGHVLVPDRLTDEQADAAWEAVLSDQFTYLRKNLSIHSVRLLIREIHRAILARHLAPPAGPTHCFNADDWEVTYEWSDRAELHDGMFCGDVLRVGRLTRLADQWVACVPVTFDENGAPDETEMRWFNSFEEANAAANPPLAAAPPPPPSDGEKG